MPREYHEEHLLDRVVNDRSFLLEAQLAFMDELHKYGGSLFVMAHAYQMTPADLAQRACMLELVDISQVIDFSSKFESDRDLPPEIALEDMLVRAGEETSLRGVDAEVEILRLGIARMKREQAWGKDRFTIFLSAAERLFGYCRNMKGCSSTLPALGMDAARRSAGAILRANPALNEQLRTAADDMVDRYFEHLTDREIDHGEYGVITIAREEQQSPAWICGKLLAMGLVHVSSKTLDPILDPELHDICWRDSQDTARSLAGRYAAACQQALTHSTPSRAPFHHEACLRLAAAQNCLRALGPDRPAPIKILTILDHLDRAVSDGGLANEELQVLGFAAHSRLHRDMAAIDSFHLNAPGRDGFPPTLC